MPRSLPALTRSDLPAELTAETLRTVPMSVLGRFARPDNGMLSSTEQAAFDAALHEIMSETAGRVSRQLARKDWEALRRDGVRHVGRAGVRPSRVEEQLRRAARRIDDQVDAAEALAPGVDWSFAQGDAARSDSTPSDDSAGSSHDDTSTVSDLEQQLSEQVELVQVMNEIADVGRRTFELEQQRDLQNTRSVFFGLVVSIAVLVAGWAPLVAADDWTERWWVIGLTLGTCVLAGGVYALVRRVQLRQLDHDGDATPAAERGSDSAAG